MFGSRANGLVLPTSDWDVVLMGLQVLAHAYACVFDGLYEGDFVFILNNMSVAGHRCKHEAAGRSEYYHLIIAITHYKTSTRRHWSAPTSCPRSSSSSPRASPSSSSAKKFVYCLPSSLLIMKRLQVSGVGVDISFDASSGLVTRALISDLLRRYPPVRPLVIVLKYFLIQVLSFLDGCDYHQTEMCVNMQRGLNETYMGGVGSFLLVLMVVHIVQASET